jgi:hypothetical protein
VFYITDVFNATKWNRKVMDIFVQSLTALGGWLLALIMFIITQRQKNIDTQNVLIRAKIDSILSLIAGFGELVALYRFFANRSGYIKKR